MRYFSYSLLILPAVGGGAVHPYDAAARPRRTPDRAKNNCAARALPAGVARKDLPPNELAQARRTQGLSDDDFFMMKSGETRQLPARPATP